MICPECKAWASVLQTRANAIGTQRRYECANLHRFSTQEIPIVATRGRQTIVTQTMPPPVANADFLVAVGLAEDLFS